MPQTRQPAALRARKGGRPSQGPPPAPLHVIHGHDDRIVRPKQLQIDRAIPCGRHLISLTHPDAVNAFIAEKMRVAMAGAFP